MKGRKKETRLVCSSCLELFEKKEIVEVRKKSFTKGEQTYRTNYCKACAKKEKHENI